MRQPTIVTRASSAAWGILGLIVLAYLFVPFHRFSPSVLAVEIMRDMHVDAGYFGLVASSFFLAYGLMQLPAGVMVDSLGPRKILPVFFAVSGLGAVCMGLAAVPGMLILGRALAGFGISVVFVSSIKITANWFPPNQFARINGLFLGIGGVGVFLASSPLAYVCATLGWRNTFIAGGILAILLALAMRVWVYDSPADKEGGAPRHADAAFGKTLKAMIPGIREILKDRQFWYATVWNFCVFSMHNGFGGLWGGPYLMHVHGLTAVEAGKVLNMMGLGVLAGGFFMGWLAEVALKSYKKTMLPVIALLFVSFVLLASFGYRFPLWGLYVWFFFLAVFGMGSVALSFAFVRKLYSASRAATAGGLMNVFPSFGVFLLQPLTGYILEHFRDPAAGSLGSTAYAMTCAPFILLGALGIVCTVLMKEPS